MATPFMAYTLHYGQMSNWGSIVITNLFSPIPFNGKELVDFIWGGFSVGYPTIQRFFALHYLLPFGYRRPYHYALNGTSLSWFI